MNIYYPAKATIFSSIYAVAENSVLSKTFFPLKKDFPKPFPQLSACISSVSALCLWFSETSHFTSSIILYDYLELNGGEVREIVFRMMKRTGLGSLHLILNFGAHQDQTYLG